MSNSKQEGWRQLLIAFTLMQNMTSVQITQTSNKTRKAPPVLTTVWPDLAKFHYFGKKNKSLLQFLMVYFVFGITYTILWQIFKAIGQIFIDIEQIIFKSGHTGWRPSHAAWGLIGSPPSYNFSLRRTLSDGPWRWTSGQLTCPLLQRYKFESRWSLQVFFCQESVFTK